MKKRSFQILMLMAVLTGTIAVSGFDRCGNQEKKAFPEEKTIEKLDAQVEKLSATVWKIKLLHHDKRAVTRKEAVQALSHESQFRNQLTEVLRSIPFSAFFWECAPFSEQNENLEFEFVVIDASSQFKGKADSGNFKEHFKNLSKDEKVTSFYNLSKDARLIVPTPIEKNQSIYYHLKNFLLDAAHEQVEAFWEKTGQELETELTKGRTIWLSTHGLGVPWLHIRLDTSPKYYEYKLYKNE